MGVVVIDEVYSERSRLVAFLAALYPSALGTDPTEPDWPVVYVDTPAGQLSWHIAPADVRFFAHVPRNESVVWDGHTTPEKYERLQQLIDRRSGAGGG